MVIDFDSRDAWQVAAVRSVLTRHPLPVLALVPAPEQLSISGVLQRRRPDIARLAGVHGIDPLVATLRALISTTAVRTVHDRSSVAPEFRSSAGAGSSPVPVLIGASTGGPQALRTVLAALPEGWHTPVVIVQHISPGFAEGLATWLASVLGRSVTLAQDGDPVRSGEIRIAPAGLHLKLLSGQYRLDASEQRNFQRPSVDYLFESAATSYGAQTIAVLLTGMGKDGAEGCTAVIAAGGRTLVQDQHSSVVWGMPGAAVAAGAATEVLPLERIGPRLTELVQIGVRQ